MKNVFPSEQMEQIPAADFDRTANRIKSKRTEREWQTLSAMMATYCRNRHAQRKHLCAECQSLLDYAEVRLSRCRFGGEKPTCAKCPVHCYQRDRREQIREVMRFAGARMLWEHPVLSWFHWLDRFRATC